MVRLLAKNHETGYCMYAIDSADEIDSLPTEKKTGTDGSGNKLECCGQGSVARCLDGTKYMLSGENVWTKYSDGGSGGGGGVNFDVQAIGDDFIDSLFE